MKNDAIVVARNVGAVLGVAITVEYERDRSITNFKTIFEIFFSSLLKA
jgi:hypothetical protein